MFLIIFNIKFLPFFFSTPAYKEPKKVNMTISDKCVLERIEVSLVSGSPCPFFNYLDGVAVLNNKSKFASPISEIFMKSSDD